MNRGDIFFEDLNFNGVARGFRPFIVLSDTTGKKFIPTVLVAPLTSRIPKKLLPTHVRIDAGQGGLIRDSLAIIEQSQIIDKSRLTNKVGTVSNDISDNIINSLLLFLGMKKYNTDSKEIESMAIRYDAFTAEFMKNTSDSLAKLTNPTFISKIKAGTLNGAIKTIIAFALGYLMTKVPLALAYLTKVYQEFIKHN